MPKHTKYSEHHYLLKEFNLALINNNAELTINLANKIHAADLAVVISEYRAEKKLTFINLVGEKFPKDLFLKLQDSVVEELINLIGAKQSAKIISKLEINEILAILEELDLQTREQLISFFSKEIKQDLVSGFSYPTDSVARFMHKNFLSVPEHWSIAQVHKHCVKHKKLISQNFYGVFVVDQLFKPIGIVQTKEIVVNSNNTLISEVMDKNFHSFNYLIDQKEVALDFNKYDLSCAPIVNNDNRIIGFIALNDVIEILEESAEENILHFGGVAESDIYSGFFRTFKQRFPWLFFNLLTAILASLVIAFFDNTIQSLVALAILMPVIASMGGNAGIQTVTIAVRALATKELNSQNVFKVIAKEFFVGIANGCFFALLCFAFIYFIFQNLKLATLFAAATIITLTIAGLAGALIPVIIKRLKGDPAISSGVILTTITDIIAFLAFLGLAALYI